MSFFGALANLFSRSGRDDNLLRQAMEHAKSNRPAKAIESYSALVGSKSTSTMVRSRALVNRALAYSSMKDDKKAIADLEEVLAMTGVSENVTVAARTQLVRVQNRTERQRARVESAQSKKVR